MLLEDVPTRLRQIRRARVDLGAVGLHHDAPVGLLVVADAHHVDRALQAQDPAGEGQGGAPLARAGLGGEAPHALLAVVVGLRDGGVRLVAAGGGDTLVLVVDVRRGVEEPLQASGAEEGSGAPEGVDLPHLLGDGDVGFDRHLLANDLLREDRGERLGSDRLARPRVQWWLQLERQIRDEVVPVLRQRALVEQELRGLHVENLRFSGCQLVSLQLFEQPGCPRQRGLNRTGILKERGRVRDAPSKLTGFSAYGSKTIASPMGRSPVESEGRLTSSSPTVTVVEPPPSRLTASWAPRASMMSALSLKLAPTL